MKQINIHNIIAMRSLIKLLILSFVLITPSIVSAHDFEVDGIYYNIDGGKAIVTYKGGSVYEYQAYSGNVIIPESVTYGSQTYAVTAIDFGAFARCSELTSITIPNSVTEIGSRAFYGCSGLNDVIISHSVTKIPNEAFSGCTRMTSAPISESVTTIGENAFKNCRGLTSVTIPKSVTEIGDAAFSGCSNLSYISVANDNPIYDSRNNCNAIICKASFSLITGCKNTIIPNTIRHIGSSAFEGCSQLTSATIPNTVWTIGKYAFQECTGLTSITIPNSVTTIKQKAFNGCSSLNSISIPNSITTIEESAFYGCSGPSSITIPQTVTTIGDYAFFGCTGLIKMDIPNSVDSICEKAFMNCSGLTCVTIPNSVVFIGNNAFSGCTALDTLNYNAVFAHFATISSNLDNFPFSNLNISTINIGDNVGSLPGGFAYGLKELTSISIPESIRVIGYSAFGDCTGLSRVNISNLAAWCSINFYNLESNPLYYAHHLYCEGIKVTNLTIPDSVTAISRAAFAGSSITNAIIPNSVKYIIEYAFYKCTELTDITIPESIIEIEENVFGHCNNITSIISLKPTPPTIAANTFSVDAITYATVYVPIGTKNYYQSAEHWKEFFNIVEFPIEVSSISLNKTSAELTVGNTLQLTATVLPSNATDRTVTWTTNNSNVATVNTNGLVTAKAVGNATITARTADGSNLSASCSVTVKQSSVLATSVSLNKTSTELIEGNTMQLTATVLPSNATNKTVTWSTSNSSVATVSSNGLVTAKAVGNATITAMTTDGSNLSASCSVTVTQNVLATSITLNKTSAVLTEGNSTQLTATVLPSNATNKTVTWTTSNSSVATVSSNGLVTAKAPGTATITATTTDGSNLSATCSLTVVSQGTVLATSISLGKTNAEMNTGGTLQLIATVLPSNATDKTVTWSTSNSSVATVTSNGLVTAKALGNATITVRTTDGTNLSATCYIIVSNAIITFADADVKALCVQNWDTNSDGELNKTEAAAVTSLGNIFKSNSSITSFNELQYFTGLVSIDQGAFDGCSRLTFITIPSNVTSIGNSAFFGCSGLTSITIPSNVTSIGSIAFGFCSKLASITVNSSNTVYDSRNNCNAIIQKSNNQLVIGCKNTIIPSSVKSIGYGAFCGCSELTFITIPSSVTWINTEAFYGCSGLMSITIPSSVTWILSSAFKGCSGLKSITVNSNNTVYDSRNNCNAIIKKSNNELVTGCKNTIIPSSVTSIGGSAFYGCSGLTSIPIPSSVTSIGSSAFYGCSGLTSITIPSSVTSIGDFAFYGCSGLTSIPIPSSVTSIGDFAFENCSGLTSIPIPSSVTSIGDYAFYGCSGLENVFSYIIHPSQITMGTNVFKILSNDYSNRTLYVPAGSTEAYQALSSWFPYFGLIKEMTIQVTSISLNKTSAELSLGETLLLTATVLPNDATNKTVTWTTSDSSIATVSINGLVTAKAPGIATITARTTDGSDLSASCSVTVKQNVVLATSISLNKTNAELVEGNTMQLTTTVLPSNATNKAVTWTTSNSSVATVNSDGLVMAKAVGNATITAKTTDGTNLSATCNITVSNSSIISFADANVKALCVQNWDTNGDGELSTSEAAAVTSLGRVFKSKENITSFDELVYFSGLSSIGDRDFYECSGLTSVTIPNSVTSIDNSAFEGCSGLTSVTIPNSVTSIGYSAFYGCSGLTSVTIPNSVTSIGIYAFYGCSGLTECYSYITNPSLVTMGSSVFVKNPSNYADRTLYVPSGSKEAYQANSSWYPYFGSIVEMVPNIPATSIELNKTAAEATVGGTLQLIATVLPDSTTNKVVTWNSSNPTIASVNENGLVTALAVGSATITAITTDGSNLSASCDVTVTEDLSNYDNYLSMSDVDAFRGDTIVIPVKMTNESSIISFQTDIFLPEGIELLQEDGEYLIDPSERMTRTHSIMSNYVSNGAIRVLCYSSNYKPFTGSSGDDLFYLTVKVADDAEGDYTIQLKNTLLTNSDFVDLAAPDVAANVNVKAYLLGDANNSGTVTITDVVVTAQYVLELNPQPFVFEAADANADGNITVADVSRIAWMVLNPTLNAPLRAPAFWNNGDRMSGNDITLMPGQTRTTSILLDNDMDYSAFQLDLALPEGLTASNFQLTDRASGHAFDVNTLSSGKTRVLCYSPALVAIDGHEGTLLTFDVTARGYVNGDILVDGIELVTTGCQSVKLDAFTIGVNNASSINESITGKIAKVEHFNLAGQKIEQPSKGVTLIVTTYTDGRRTTSKVFN